LLEDAYQDIKIIFTAIKAIKLVIKSEKINSYNKIITRLNLKRLVGTLMLKLNDPKEIVRNEVERLIIIVGGYMSTKELILQLLASFQSSLYNDLGHRAIMQIIMILLLKENENYEGLDEEEIEMWGA